MDRKGLFFMKKIFYLAAIVVAVLGVQKLYDVYGSREAKEVQAPVSEVIESVFEEERICESESNIEGYYYYGSMYLSEEGCHELLGKIADSLGVKSEYSYYRERNENGYLAELRKEGADSTLVLKLITIEKEESENLLSQQQYISIQLDIEDSVNSGFYYRNLIQNTMNQLFQENENKFEGISEKHTYADNLWLGIKGKIYGVVEPERQKQIAEAIVKGVGAKEVFHNEEAISVEGENMSLYSMYAYTPGIEDYVAVGNEKINVNIVFSYDEINHVTYVHIGSPIINYDY